jgi:hypothetical protein
MAAPDQLRDDLTSLPLDWCVTKWVLEAAPFVFGVDGQEKYWRWKTELAHRLEIDSKNVLITGSGAAGVSLNPNKGLRPFAADSDIDVAVVSAYHFDVSWRTLRNLGAERYRLTVEQQAAVREHVERFIYWGTIATDRLLPILPFARPWFEAIDYMQRMEPTAGRPIELRIYRDYDSLRSYVRTGLSKLREQIIGPASTTSEAIA